MSALDLVVLELPMPVSKGFPLLLTKLNNVPTALDFGDIWFGPQTRSEVLRVLQNGLYRLLCDSAETITVPTEAMARFLRDFTGARVAKLPFPIDTRDLFNPSLYTGDPPEKLGEWTRKRDVVIYAGSLSSEKGCESIPSVVERVTAEAEGRRVGFLLIGGGPLQGSLESRVEELGLGEHVRFVGPRGGRDFPRLLSLGSAALSLSPSNAVDFAPSNVSKIAGYLAMGKPVVAVRDLSSEECVDQGKTGYLVSLEKVHSALLEIIRQPSLRSEMSTLARSKAETTHDCVVVASTLLGLVDLI
jgi:glycosyltransferase involved in cell wall biosynthesis